MGGRVAKGTMACQTRERGERGAECRTGSSGNNHVLSRKPAAKLHKQGIAAGQAGFSPCVCACQHCTGHSSTSVSFCCIANKLFCNNGHSDSPASCLPGLAHRRRPAGSAPPRKCLVLRLASWAQHRLGPELSTPCIGGCMAQGPRQPWSGQVEESTGAPAASLQLCWRPCPWHKVHCSPALLPGPWLLITKYMQAPRAESCSARSAHVGTSGRSPCNRVGAATKKAARPRISDMQLSALCDSRTTRAAAAAVAGLPASSPSQPPRPGSGPQP